MTNTTTLFWWALQNTLVIAVLVLVVSVSCRRARLRPAVQHALWVVVLVKFLSPAVVYWPWSVKEWIEPLRLSADREQPSDLHGSVPVARRGGPRPAPDALADDEGLLRPPLELSPDEQEVVARILTPMTSTDALMVRSTDVTGPLATFADVNSPAGSLSFAPRSGPQRALESQRGKLTVHTWLGLGFVVWACGGLVFGGVQFRRALKVRRIVARSRPAPGWLEQSVREVAARIGVASPRAIIVPGLSSPCLWCVGRPRLLWPERLGVADSPRWRAVIGHELAHLRRGDHWVSWLELFAGCVWWWNPLFWLVRRQVRETAEMSCDAWAVWAVPGGEREYAESLVEVTRLVSRIPAPAPLLGVSSGARRSLERRLTMILSECVPCRLPLAGVLSAGLLAAVALPAWSLEEADRPSTTAPVTADESAATATAPKPAKTRRPSATGAIAAPVAAPLESPPEAGRAPDGVPAPPTAPAGAPVAVPPTPRKTATAAIPASADEGRISRLEDQLKVLLEEVRSLRGAARATDDVSPPPTSTRKGPRAASAPAFSPDGRLLAVVTDDGTIALLEAESGREVRRIALEQGEKISSLAFSPSGQVLAARLDGALVQLDVATGKIMSTATTSRPGRTPAAANSDAGVSGSADDSTLGPTASSPDAKGPPGVARTRAALSVTPRTPSDPLAAKPGPNAPAAASALAQSFAGAQIDLIRLATEHTDAVGSQKLAQRRLEALAGNRESISASELVTAEVNLETAANKVRLLRAIAEAARDATKSELQQVEKLRAAGFSSSSEEAQHRAKLAIIELILGSEETSKTETRR